MNITTFKTLNSTNSYVKNNIDKLVDKDIISTDIQTSGHGRFDRAWVDLGKNNIYMTFVLKPSEKIENKFANLTQYLSVCVCKEIEMFNLKPEIKWPNDILISGKKICGILAETVVKGEKLKGIALGIGLNLHASIEDLEKIDRPVTALNLEGIFVKKDELISKIVKRFFDNYESFLNSGFLFIKDDYEKYSVNLKQCKIAVFSKIKEGEFKGFDDCGNIILSTNDCLENINMGEII